MFPNYLAVEKRCAIDLTPLNLPVANEHALEILIKEDFEVVHVDLVALARECIGKAKYRRGSPIHNAPTQMDCSSFMKWLYAQKGIRLPRRTIQQRNLGESVEACDLLPGDLVFVSGELNYYFDDPADGVGHVGIATGQGSIVHAANSQVGIEEMGLSEFLKKGFRGAKRIIPQKSNVLTLTVPFDRDVESSDDIRWIIFGLTRKLRRKT